MTNGLMRRDFDLFDRTPFNFFENFGRNLFDSVQTDLMRTDIRETDTDYLLEVEIPGIPKENVKIKYEDGILTIEGMMASEATTEDTKGTLLRQERSLSSVKRQYRIDNVKDEEAKASYQDGVLTLTLPKKEIEEKFERIIPIE